MPTGSMSPSAFVARNVVSTVKFPTLDVDLECVDERVSRVLSVFRDGGKESTAQALLTSTCKPNAQTGSCRCDCSSHGVCGF